MTWGSRKVENATRTGRLIAVKFPHVQDEQNGGALNGHIGDQALIAAVNPMRRLPTQGTGGTWGDAFAGHDEPFRLTREGKETKTTQMGKDRL